LSRRQWLVLRMPFTYDQQVMRWISYHQPRSRALRLLQPCLLACFFFAQTAALLHAEVHEFHEHEAECELYASVEKQPTHSVSVPYHAPARWCAYAVETRLVFRAGDLAGMVYDARAPPSLTDTVFS